MRSQETLKLIRAHAVAVADAMAGHSVGVKAINRSGGKKTNSNDNQISNMSQPAAKKKVALGWQDTYENKDNPDRKQN